MLFLPPPSPAKDVAEEGTTHGVSDQTDRVTGGESGQAAAQAGGQVDEPGVERVRIVGREASDDQDRDDEPVHGDDTRHDDRDQRLFVE